MIGCASLAAQHTGTDTATRTSVPQIDASTTPPELWWGRNLHGYTFAPWPPSTGAVDCGPLVRGDAVFVHLPKDRGTGAAHVLEPIHVEEGHPFKGRIKVQFLDNGSTYHVRPSRVTKVEGWTQVVIVCDQTTQYRDLARTQVRPSEFVVELGSSYGVCTALLAMRCAKCIGVEISEEAVAEARTKYPGVHFECFDAVLQPQRLEHVSAGAQTLFVDVGGDRDLGALLQLLPSIQKVQRPNLIVLKSKKLKAHMLEHQPKMSCEEWWGQLEVQYGQGNGHRAIDLGHKHPMAYPARLDPTGKQICRFWNYGSCYTDDCKYTHDWCNECLALGHRAMDCPNPAATEIPEPQSS